MTPDTVYGLPSLRLLTEHRDERFQRRAIKRFLIVFVVIFASVSSRPGASVSSRPGASVWPRPGAFVGTLGGSRVATG